jgi:hypothetical protein
MTDRNTLQPRLTYFMLERIYHQISLASLVENLQPLVPD